MSMASIALNTTPVEEACAQVGSEGYEDRARREAYAFIHQLLRLGRPPVGASLGVKWFPHDFGRYLSVMVNYDEEVEAAVDYALSLEGDGPLRWDEEALEELRRER